MTDIYLYKAPLLDSEQNHILPSVDTYLQTLVSQHIQYSHEFVLHDEITVEISVLEVGDYGYNASYATITNSVSSAYYYITHIGNVTPNTIAFTMKRDYVHQYVGTLRTSTLLNGLYTQGHYPLTHNAYNPPTAWSVPNTISYDLPIPAGDCVNVLQNRAFVPNKEWGSDARGVLVFRAVLDKQLTDVRSKIVLIKQSTPYPISEFKANIDTLVRILGASKKLQYVVNPNAVSPIIIDADIVEITDAWIVPEWFEPPERDGVHNFVLVGANGPITTEASFTLAYASSFSYQERIPVKNNARIFVGNPIKNIEIPHTTPVIEAVVYSTWGVDDRISMSIRVGDKVLDISDTMLVATDVYQNDSATMSSKINRALGALSGAVTIGVGVATKNPATVAGGIIGVASSVTQNVGIVTNSYSTGADGLQSPYAGVNVYTPFRSKCTVNGGPLQLIAYNYNNSKSVHDAINNFGVNTSHVISALIDTFMINKYQYTKFDNVRVESYGVTTPPPQFRAQLREMLLRGVYIWNVSPANYDLQWDGDFNEFI